MTTEERKQVIFAIIGTTILSVLFLLAYRINILNNPIVSAILALSFFSAIAILIISINPDLINPKRKIGRIDDIIVIIGILTYTIIGISLINGYGTDDMEYVVEALKNLLSGINPYTAIYHPYNVGPTYLISGKIASNYIYPPLSFIMYLPAYLILSLFHFPLYYVNIINIIFQDFLSIIIYLNGRSTKDPIATLPIIFGFITAGLLAPSFAGVTSTVWAVFLALCYIYNDKKSGIFLALANSFNQISWLITPFILIYKHKNGNTNFVKILYTYIISLLTINLPFFLWNPTAFINIFTLDSNTIPVAITGFTLFNITTLFSVEPWFFTFTLILTSIILLYIYTRFFDKLKESIWIFPMLILWFEWRTLTSYFLMWPQLAFLSIFKLNSNNNIKVEKIYLKKAIKFELLGVLMLFVVSISAAGVVSHIQYISQDPIEIIKIEIPNNTNNSNISVHINKLLIIVKNTKNETVNVTLVRVSVPNSLNMVWNFSSPPIPPNSTTEIFAYTTNPKLFINASSFTVQVYSNYFITSYKVTLYNETNSTYIKYENTTNIS
ncbi:hypothetical protein DFR86_02380 [Acidianus sulfidivorans JP7]|uniref:DUF2029 domain-containing protein n=1 Tax=Acidianus sulfidivorans JP7 TaxID=619593 RepID=A0A2U9IKE2_9CREN|nr:hypothetical protein [Acidianus sulfidivorans]AWR96507.1 hypothetical protein DFR86_02380 [Acidianus sulfidivorans JP7]